MGTKFSRKATAPQRIGSPISVSHITIAVAIPTAAFMSVIVTRYARNIAFDLLRDVDGLALVGEAWQYLDEAPQECVARDE